MKFGATLSVLTLAQVTKPVAGTYVPDFAHQKELFLGTPSEPEAFARDRSFPALQEYFLDVSNSTAEAVSCSVSAERGAFNIWLMLGTEANFFVNETDADEAYANVTNETSCTSDRLKPGDESCVQNLLNATNVQIMLARIDQGIAENLTMVCNAATPVGTNQETQVEDDSEVIDDEKTAVLRGNLNY